MPPSGPAAIEFRVLGPVEALRDGVSLPLGGPRQRTLLALLLVEVGRPVAADRLIDELWLGRPPPGAAVTLPSYVSRLRATLGRDVVIESSASGYVLEVSPDRIDSARFERLAREGQEALARGAAQRATERLRAGLALWRGRPFSDVGDDGALRVEADRLGELRLRALEERIEAELALGGGAELVDELETHLREHPYREQLWRQLMLALYRAQRQAEALAAYRRARAVLDEELGLEPSEQLKLLEQAILRQSVPVVQPPEERHNLPAALTSFIGRAAELDDLGRLLGDERLVTLTGVGGVGKTRLALEAASRALADFPDGILFVDLSSLVDPRLVPRQLALALELGDGSGVDVSETLAGELRTKDLLLVLDNCEHVRDACAELAHELLTACPQLRVLATSRELLGVPGEIDYPVAPLAVPRREAAPDEVRASDAVRLFLARARAVRPHLPDDDRALASVARICTDLDGLPLAVELAAARAKAFALDDIAARLSDRFRFLVSWRRLAAARHRTLREAMDWSYELLNADEQALLARLSVFAGDFTHAAAAEICLDGDEDRALELLERLVAVSLVFAEERDQEMRYRLLETVRQYAAERLDAETAEETRRAHARHFLDVARSADLTAVERRGKQRLEVAVAAQDNLRSALAWSVASGSVAFGLELATSLERFWVTHDPHEGMRWFGALLDRPEAAAVDPAVRANALRAYGGAADIAGMDERAEQLWRQSLDLFEELGDDHGRAVLLHRLGIGAMRRGDLAQATELVETSHQLHERRGDRWGQAQTLGTLGAIARDTGEQRRAFALIEQSLELARDAGVTWWQSGTLAELANLSLDAGDVDGAESCARESLALADGMGDRAGRVFGVALLARVAAERGDRERAAQLWAAVEHEDAGAPLGGWRRHRAAYETFMREHVMAGADGSGARAHPVLEDAVSLALQIPE